MMSVPNLELDEQAEFMLDDWMFVSGYSQEKLSAMSDELLDAVGLAAQDWGCEFRNTNNEGTDNPFTEYLEVVEKEQHRRNSHEV